MPLKSTAWELMADPDMLSDAYVPQKLTGREKETQQLQECLSPALRHKRPFNAWLWGPSGTGKTAAAKHVFIHLREKSAVPTAYVDCWDHNTLYGVLNAIIRQLEIIGAETPSAQVKLDCLHSFVKDKPLVIFLDEIDACVYKQRNSILYELLGIVRCGLVCISTSRRTLDELDEKIESRLNPNVLQFRPYSQEEMVGLLVSRARQALPPNAYDEQALQVVAELAHGDARYALQCLRAAAYKAGESGADKITPEHVRNAQETLGNCYCRTGQRNLNTHERLIADLVQQDASIGSSHLKEAYRNTCRTLGVTPVASRTFTDYLSHLLHLGVIELDELRSRGNSRSFLPGKQRPKMEVDR